MCDGTAAAAAAAAVTKENRWHEGGDRIFGYLSCIYVPIHH